MSTSSDFKCRDCGKITTAHSGDGCPDCQSNNIEPVETKGWVKTAFVVFVVTIILFLTGILSITTQGCTLPIDLVFGDICLFGSFGASLGATIAMVVLMSILVLLWRLISYFFRSN